MIFAKNFTRNYEKKILGTSDAWLTSHLSQQTSVLYHRLSDICTICIKSYAIFLKIGQLDPLLSFGGFINCTMEQFSVFICRGRDGGVCKFAKTCF